MAEIASPFQVARFGPYEVNPRLGEVRKFGTRIKFGEQPLRILILLMERQGDLVTREELRHQLWPANTFVDFDHSLNSAIQRLRDCLSDTAEKGQWIETVPRRGYRFVGSVAWDQGNRSARPMDVFRAVAAEPVFEPLAPEIKPASSGKLWRAWLIAGFAALLVVAAVLVKAFRDSQAAKSATTIRRLAVLPLENVSGDPSQDYFADGMTDELITALAKNRSLRVISRTSVMQYKGARRPVRDIARELGVDGVLEGSISKSASRVHMTVQLIHAATDTHVWAESYDRDLEKVQELPSELSQTIAKEVQVAVTAPAPARPVNPEAHDLYLRARYIWFSGNSEQPLAYLQKAIQLQPDYAAAWSGVSAYYGGRAVSGGELPQLHRAEWESTSLKALQLDDSLSDAHNSMAAWYFFGLWDWNRSEAESQRAVTLDANDAEAYHVYSYILTVKNRPQEAIAAQKHGMEVDPFARPWALGLTYYNLHMFDAAIADLLVREQGTPSNQGIHEVLSDAYHAAGLDRQAVDQWKQLYRLDNDNAAAATIEQLFSRGGYSAVTEWRLAQEKAAARKQYYSPYWLGLWTAKARHKEETLRLLEAAYREHAPRLVFLQCEPAFDFLHQEPRYQAIVRKIGFPPVR